MEDKKYTDSEIKQAIFEVFTESLIPLLVQSMDDAFSKEPSNSSPKELNLECEVNAPEEVDYKMLNQEVATIDITRRLKTSDPKIIRYYVDLCQKGEFTKRLARLIQLDAYGEIKTIEETNELSNSEKINVMCTSLKKLAEVIGKEQLINQTTVAVQNSLAKKVNLVGQLATAQMKEVRKIKETLVKDIE